MLKKLLLSNVLLLICFQHLLCNPVSEFNDNDTTEEVATLRNQISFLKAQLSPNQSTVRQDYDKKLIDPALESMLWNKKIENNYTAKPYIVLANPIIKNAILYSLSFQSEHPILNTLVNKSDNTDIINFVALAPSISPDNTKIVVVSVIKSTENISDFTLKNMVDIFNKKNQSEVPIKFSKNFLAKHMIEMKITNMENDQEWLLIKFTPHENEAGYNFTTMQSDFDHYSIVESIGSIDNIDEVRSRKASIDRHNIKSRKVSADQISNGFRISEIDFEDIVEKPVAYKVTFRVGEEEENDIITMVNIIYPDDVEKAIQLAITVMKKEASTICLDTATMSKELKHLSRSKTARTP